MRLLDRYIISNFLIPFSLCFFGFLGIWFVFDFAGNAQDFVEARVSVGFILRFYATQVPQFAVLCLPVGLLLSLLYAMTKMSRSNEIIAMLTAGQSLLRLTIPLLGVGLVLTGVLTWLNYRLAPHAEAYKKQTTAEVLKRKEGIPVIGAQLFRNRISSRSWFVGFMPAKPTDWSVLIGLHIMEQDADGNVTTKWYAQHASYRRDTRSWLLEKGKTVKFDKEGNVLSDTPFVKLEITGWAETPWRIASSKFDAQSLSVSELRDYLKYNADFPDTALAVYRTHLQNRWALPWQCIVVVLLAVPLGVVFSRRGVLSGVGGAIFCFAGMMFSNNLMLALGKGSRLPPSVAAWSPTVVFLVVGCYLFYIKSTNREAPKLSNLFRFR